MNITPTIVESFVKLAVGEELWLDILALVTIWDTKNVSNVEKKKAVLAAVQEIAHDIGHVLLGIAIDLTVFWLRQVSADAEITKTS